MKKFITIMILVSLTISAFGQKGKISGLNLLISPYSPRNGNQSISVYNFNNETGEATFKSEVKAESNPSYIVINSEKNHVYSVSEVEKGTISSFSFDPVTGKLVLMNSVPSGGNGPTSITIDKQSKFIFCANYGSGSVSAIPINNDGSLKSEAQVFKHEPKSNGTGRQKGSHAHATVLTPDGKYLMVPDLGTDKINIYSYDGTKTINPLEPGNPPFVNVKSGSGPRHMDFHPNGKYAYVIHELEGLITIFDYKNGNLSEKQTITLLAPGYTGRIGAADIHVSPDGKFLYASNRGDANEIVIFKINKDGTLVNIGRQPALGTGAREFIIDPSGNYLLIANNTSNKVNIFRINKKTGLLTPTENSIDIKEPGCLKLG